METFTYCMTTSGVMDGQDVISSVWHDYVGTNCQLWTHKVSGALMVSSFVTTNQAFE